MTPELLLQHFNRISEAPDAIPRLRRFILDLAVRGKLVEQDPHDEPASELLKRIQAEKARLVKLGLARSGKSVAIFEESPFRLPKSWQWSQLGIVGFISPRNLAEDDLLTSFVPMPMISADYGVSNQHEIRPWGEIKSGYTHFAEGDVGLAKITPCFENGKSTVFRGLAGGIGAGTTELHIVRPVLLSADYIVIFLKSPYFIGTGIPKMTGTAGQKRVPTEYFTTSPFPLPPLAEQQRIVAKVNELMTLCDQLEAARNQREAHRDKLVAASLNRISTTTAEEATQAARFHLNLLPRLTTKPEHIKQLRQTILNLAVRGRLVEQDPNDEPAAELLKRIQAEKERLVKEGKIRKQQALPAVKNEEQYIDLPKQWAWVRLGSIIHLVSGQHLQPPEYSEDKQAGIPYITGPSDFGQGELLITRYALVRKAVAYKGQLLLTVKGSGVGKTTTNNLSEVAISRQLMALTAIEWNSQYMELVTYRLAENLRECARSLIPGISREDVDAFVVPLPPLAEQKRIVAKVEELMTLCDQLEAQLTTTESDSRCLLEAVLRDALNPEVKEAA